MFLNCACRTLIYTMHHNRQAFGIKLPPDTDVFYDKSEEVPPLEQLLYQLMRYCCISQSTFVFAFLYMKQVFEKYPERISGHTFARLFLSAVLIATKYVDDDQMFSNKMFQRLCRTWFEDVQSLNRCEVAFVTLLNYDFTLSAECYQREVAAIVAKDKHENCGSNCNALRADAVFATDSTWLSWHWYAPKRTVLTKKTYADVVAAAAALPPFHPPSISAPLAKFAPALDPTSPPRKYARNAYIA